MLDFPLRSSDRAQIQLPRVSPASEPYRQNGFTNTWARQDDAESADSASEIETTYPKANLNSAWGSSFGATEICAWEMSTFPPIGMGAVASGSCRGDLAPDTQKIRSAKEGRYGLNTARPPAVFPYDDDVIIYEILRGRRRLMWRN